MHPKIRTTLLLIFVCPLLIQCVQTKDVTNLDLRIRSLDNRMVKLDKDLVEFETKIQDDQVMQLQKKQAEMSDLIDHLNLEILQIKGLIEENGHHYRNSLEGIDKFKQTLHIKVADISDQIVLLADQMNQTNENLNFVKKANDETKNQVMAAQERARAAEIAAEESSRKAAEQAAQLAAEQARRTEAEEARKKQAAAMAQKTGPREIVPEQTKLKPGEKTKVKAKNKPQIADSSQGPGKEIYDRALRLFRKREFNEAYRTFTEYIDQYPKGKMAPNARFWLGDCYYNQQEYELAILEYQKVIADYPSHIKAPAALLKQGLAFEKLKDNNTAKIVYQKLMEEYSKSDQVATAKKRMESLK